MKNKWNRIIIGAAGMYIEVILSAIAIYVWWFTKPGMLHYLALNTFFVTTITTVIFNANPLMRFDGYYMMSDFLEIPNLRAKSDKMLREAFSWYCLGIESRPDPFMPETGKGWFVTYAIAAWCYRWVILISISTFLYTVLKPYDLQSIGITLCVFSMAGIVFAMFRNVYQIVATPRMEPMSKIKIFISLSLFVGACYLIASIPIRWYHHAPFYMEPVDVVHVTSGEFGGKILTPEDWKEIHEDLQREQDDVLGGINWVNAEKLLGQQRFDPLAELPAPALYSRRIKPHDIVTEGEVLAIVDDPQAVRYRDDFVSRLKQWEIQGRIVMQHREAAGQVNAVVQIHEAKEQMLKLRKQIEDTIELLNARVIKAPISGTIVAPDRIPEPQRDEVNRTKLARWHGTPLDEENAGCVVDPGMELLKIAPSDKLHAVLYIDQGDREDLKDDMEIELKLDHLPDISYVAPVTLVSRLGEKVAPESLTTKYGGPLATRNKCRQ